MAERSEERPTPGGEGCHVAESAGGRLQVRISGLLYAGWSGRLAAALASRRISVVSGRGARRGAGNVWDIELLVDPLDKAVDAWALDYLRLAREGRSPAEDAANLVLDSFALVRTGEELVVDVEGVDRLGFLDRILRVFAFYGLFPRELRIETRGQRVRDQFRLQTSTGQAPTLQLCEAVGLRLRDLAGPPTQ